MGREKTPGWQPGARHPLSCSSQLNPIPSSLLQATCERGFAAMEETHQKKIEDLQRQHQRELEKLREEKDRLLAEETAATISGTETAVC